MSLTPRDHQHIDALAVRLKRCRNLLFITGAGLSADSDLPTYRGLGGLYEERDTEDGMAIEQALSGGMMTNRPELCWKYIARIEAACRGARPNAGHHVIAAMERHFPRVWVLTQNVDGLHRAAGSANIIDIHGDIHQLLCRPCGYRRQVPDYEHVQLPPVCPECGAVMRPEVVLFGEMLPQQKVAHLQQEAGVGFDIVFSVGTSSLFPYIVEPVIQAAALGVPTVEINPSGTDLSLMVSHKIGGGAAESLGAIWRRYWQTTAPR